MLRPPPLATIMSSVEIAVVAGIEPPAWWWWGLLPRDAREDSTPVRDEQPPVCGIQWGCLPPPIGHHVRHHPTGAGRCPNARPLRAPEGGGGIGSGRGCDKPVRNRSRLEYGVRRLEGKSVKARPT